MDRSPASDTISIAMATYNGARWLRLQLDSFAAQTLRPDELVITDDGSTDGTAEVVTAFAANAPFSVHFHRNSDRLGYNRNFATAIGRCIGDVVFISDQDDEWAPEKLATVMTAFAKQPDMLSVTNDQLIVDGQGNPLGTTVLENLRGLGYPDEWFGPGCCTALRRPLLEVLSPFPGNVVPYDQWITLVPTLLGARLLLDRPLQSYRRHDANTSGSAFAQARPSRGTLVAAALAGDARIALAGKVAELEAVAGRLNERADAIAALGLAERLPAATYAAQKERDAYAARVHCLDRPRWRRSPAVARLWLRGGYRPFKGALTAAKDLLS